MKGAAPVDVFVRSYIRFLETVEVAAPVTPRPNTPVLFTPRVVLRMPETTLPLTVVPVPEHELTIPTTLYDEGIPLADGAVVEAPLSSDTVLLVIVPTPVPCVKIPRTQGPEAVPMASALVLLLVRFLTVLLLIVKG